MEDHIPIRPDQSLLLGKDLRVKDHCIDSKHQFDEKDIKLPSSPSFMLSISSLLALLDSLPVTLSSIFSWTS